MPTLPTLSEVSLRQYMVDNYVSVQNYLCNTFIVAYLQHLILNLGTRTSVPSREHCELSLGLFHFLLQFFFENRSFK